MVIGGTFAAIALPLLLASAWLGLSQAAKRAHDQGHSGWLALGTLLPILGLPLVAYFYLWPGRTTESGYGAPESGNAPASARQD